MYIHTFVCVHVFVCLYNPVLLGTSDIFSFISNTSREYKYFYFRRFNNYTIVFISEIVIQICVHVCVIM